MKARTGLGKNTYLIENQFDGLPNTHGVRYKS
jgi:hypothetical protein